MLFWNVIRNNVNGDHVLFGKKRHDDRNSQPGSDPLDFRQRLTQL